MILSEIGCRCALEAGNLLTCPFCDRWELRERDDKGRVLDPSVSEVVVRRDQEHFVINQHQGVHVKDRRPSDIDTSGTASRQREKLLASPKNLTLDNVFLVLGESLGDARDADGLGLWKV